MRVGIPVLTLVPGLSGGSETYTRGLLRGLSHVGTMEYRVLAPLLAPNAGGGLPSAVATGYRASRTVPGRLAAMALATARPGSLRAVLRGAGVVHYPLTVPIPRVDVPWATTLHDVQHLELPELFPRGERAFRRLAYDRTARRADAVIVVSEFVRGRAVDLLGLDPGRVHAIPLGVDHDRFRPGVEEREPFVLYPARPWPHKNHARLLDGFRLLRARRPELRLVLTGAGTETLAGDGVEPRGAVSGDELAGLYRRASCLVFPSLYEGFGLPPLEAMASGCPVAAATVAAVREVCGDAAVLFDPHDPEAIAVGVEDALRRAGELRAHGLARAAAFTWEETARAHERVYAALGP